MPEDVIDPEMEQRGEPLQPVVAPAPQQQLTPVQQRFLNELRSTIPSNATPFTFAQTPGGPALQGMESPGYAAAYQPAESFTDPSYQNRLLEWEQEVRRTAEAARAEQAIQAGIRFIYQRRYDDDLKRGVPEQQAFSKMMLGIAMHGPKTDPIKAYEAFRARPAPTAQMMRFGTNEVPGVVNVDRSGAQRWTPVPQSALPQAAFTPKTLVVDGQRVIQLGPNRWQYLGQEVPTDKLPAGVKASIFKQQIAEADKALEELPTGPEFKQQRDRFEAQRKAATDARDAMVKGPQAQESKTDQKRIRVVSPNGQVGTVSEANLEEALKAGYKRQ